MMTLHTTGGLAMLKAARAALKAQKNPPILLGVTVLTSLDEAELVRIGLRGPVGKRVTALARMAKVAGMDGVVSAGEYVERLRKALGDKMVIVVPGIRLAEGRVFRKGRQCDDQAQVATPANAVRWGADYLVVGRPITSAPDPARATDAILKEIELAGETSRRHSEIRVAKPPYR